MQEAWIITFLASISGIIVGSVWRLGIKRERQKYYASAAFRVDLALGVRPPYFATWESTLTLLVSASLLTIVLVSKLPL